MMRFRHGTSAIFSISDTRQTTGSTQGRTKKRKA